jgi:S-adenosylmethionine-diacylglycerol 3-amino-3-carboxypropyl transferase
LIYNTSWEDPRIDKEYLNINKNDRIATITSAGCNVLDYLLDEPSEIHTCDINFRQNAILELKIALIKYTDHKTLFQIFGQGHFKCFKSLYFDYLREYISENSRYFWDSNFKWFLDEKGFYYHGTTGYFASKIIEKIKNNDDLKLMIIKLFNAKNIEQQKEIYNSLSSLFWNKSIVKFVDNRFILSFLGVPSKQRTKIYREYPEGLINFLKTKMSYTFTNIPVHENYFWYVYFFGHYSNKTLPNYLKEENFNSLKNNIDKIKIHNVDISHMLKNKINYFSKFVLLDHQDWLSPEQRSIEWNRIKNSSTKGAKFVLRSVSKYHNFPDYVHFDKLSSSKLVKLDRVGTYAELVCGKIK